MFPRRLQHKQESQFTDRRLFIKQTEMSVEPKKL